MKIVRTKKELQEAIRWLRAEGKTIGLVPTMGALHSGHLSLMRAAKKHADAIVVYIFVNPMQFAPHEDLTRYPRPWEADVELCRNEGVELLYAPSEKDVYPEGYGTVVSVKGVSEELDGVSRPAHFDGVATVLAKMFIRITPDAVMFGEKDYQQLQVVKKLVRDLDLPINVIGVPTEREEGKGLAKSSRNAYLSEKEATIAPELFAIMQDVAKKIKQGSDIIKTLDEGKAALLAAGFAGIDYFELRDGETLAPVTSLARPARLLAAVHLGTTRLIDNIAVGAEER